MPIPTTLLKAQEINLSLAARLISTQFPEWGDLPIKPVEAGGHDNRTFLLGDEMCIRLPSDKSYADHVPIEHEWLPKLGGCLPLSITRPIALGRPGCGYPWPWSINRWIPGETASPENVGGLSAFAKDLAEFLNALQGLDATGAPQPGPENFFRGGSLSVYDSETQESIANLAGLIDSGTAMAIWEESLEAVYSGPPVWVHGDVAPGNLIVSNGRLSGVIDFGQLAAGDPSCDLAIAWTFFSGMSRNVFRECLNADESAWKRGRGWALWKALITLDSSSVSGGATKTAARTTIDEIIEDYTLAGEQRN